MAAARLSAIFTLILNIIIQVSHGQLLGLNNKPGLTLNNCPLGSPQQALQRKAGLITNPKNFNQIAKSGIVGSNLLQQQSNMINSQQPGNLQSINLQQPLNCQQQLNLQQQPFNINLQQASQNQNCHTLNLQQQLLQQQQYSLPVTNLQQQQLPVSANDISFSSLPTINGQISGLPLQISQEVLLSNLGLTSSLPNLLPNSCPNQFVDQIPVLLPQNNLGSFSNVPTSLIDGSQANNLPISLSSSALNAAFNGLPASFQNIQQTSSQQTQQNQASLKPVPTLQFSVQNQPAAAVQSQPLMPSFILSPNTSPQFAPGSTAYPNSVVNQQPSNPGAKPSSIKALLPLLFNLLKDKSPCCGCRPNNNCGCANNNTNNNINKNNVPVPSVSGGYSKQINYSQTQEQSTNAIESEEFESCENLRKRRKYRKYKNKYNDSAEYDADDYAEDYDNED